MNRFPNIDDKEIKLRKVRVRAIRPYSRPPFQDATLGPFHTFHFASIWVQDEDGQEGESFFFLSQLPVLERFYLPILFHAPSKSYESLYHQLYWSIRNEGFRGPAATALGQLDWALYDLYARRKALPLHRLLGADKDRVKIYASGAGVNYSYAQLKSEMEHFAKEGYEIVKMKVGVDFGKNMREDLRRIAFVREVIGENMGLALDANQVWRPPQALDFAHRAAKYNIAWLEEPVHSADLMAIREICQKSPIPISYGESEKTDKVFPFLAEIGVRHLQPIAGYQASIKEWLNVRDLAEEQGLFFTSGGYSQITAQLVASCQPDTYTEYLEANNGTINPFLSVKPEIREGYFILPELPGSSIRIDWDAIEKQELLAFDQSWSKKDVAPIRPVVM